ncbi:hypothetical protein FrCorBMG51_23515 [Protofrankia coriariae]|uniref:Uncharacterized protein n=1 Tax=Protofrankia coriariae TaxID=1562887 RepID=A0ABR5EYV6_9ACTN|nr:hypothetical protein FrCorBMG51_23515 [Protofrankia coriariae]
MIVTESPADDPRRLVTPWIFTRIDDPYQGIRCEPGSPNLWFGPLPQSEHTGSGPALCHSCWIEEGTHRVICDTFTTLTRPLVKPAAITCGKPNSPL